MSFGLGFALGALTLVVLRHELSLNSRARTVAALLAVGALLLGVLVAWARRLERGAQPAPDPWRAFLWTGTSLVLAYLTLVAAVLFG